MDSRHFVGALGGFLALAALAAPVAAQPAAPEPAEARLERALQPGDRVTITDLAGGTVKGRFVDIEDGILRVRQQEEVRRVPIDTVGKVRRTRMGMQLGTLIGLGIGLGLGTLAASYGENEGTSAAAAFFWLTGISTAVGVTVDAAVNLPRTVYDRDRARTVSVAPVVTPRAAGVAVRIGF